MESPRKILLERLKASRRIAVLGIGSDLRQDDAAGVMIAVGIGKKAGRPGSKRRYRVFVGSTAPENLTGEIVRYKPDHLLIIDTIDIKKRPGTVVILDPFQVGGGVSFSTHTLPARVLIDYIAALVPGCRSTIIGIQPKSLKFDNLMTVPVKSAVKSVTTSLISALSS